MIEHPIVADLQAAEVDYIRSIKKMRTLKAAYQKKLEERRSAITQAIMENPDVGHVELSRRFGVSEGMIRHLRRRVSEQ